MVKCIISALVAFLIIIFGGIYENIFIHTTFHEMTDMLDAVHSKLLVATAKEDDILAVQRFWISKKSKLHICIPHTEIKEVDLWISECVTYTKYQKFDDAEAKIEVVKELCEQIPNTFRFKIGNLF